MSRIEQIAELIADKLQPQIPVANQLWDSADIANYLRRSQQVMAWALAHKEHAKGRRRAAMRETELQRGSIGW